MDSDTQRRRKKKTWLSGSMYNEKNAPQWANERLSECVSEWANQREMDGWRQWEKQRVEGGRDVRRTKSVTITRSRSNALNPFDVKLDADRHHNYLIVERYSRKLQNELKTSCSVVTLEKSCLKFSHSHNRQRQQWQDHSALALCECVLFSASIARSRYVLGMRQAGWRAKPNADGLEGMKEEEKKRGREKGT